MAHKTKTDHEKDLIRKTFNTDSGRELLDIWKKTFVDPSSFDESDYMMVIACTNKDFVQRILNAMDLKLAKSTLNLAVDNSKKK